MKNESLYHTELEVNSTEHSKLYASEELSFNVTEDILIHMEDLDVSKKELAEKLGKTKSYISQLLSGSKNMTLRTLSEICFALNLKPTVHFQEISVNSIECKPVVKNAPSNWQDVAIECNLFAETLVKGTGVLSKSNVIIRNDKEFWKKAA